MDAEYSGVNTSQSNRLFSKLANVIEGPPLKFPVSMSPDYEEADMVSECMVSDNLTFVSFRY